MKVIALDPSLGQQLDELRVRHGLRSNEAVLRMALSLVQVVDQAEVAGREVVIVEAGRVVGRVGSAASRS